MVAGYIASSFQWRRFSEQWDKLLRRANVPVDPKYGQRLVHRNKLQHLKGPFEKWTETDRDDFLNKAYAIIRRHTRMPIGNAVFRNHFEEVASKSLQTTLGGAYGWCAYACLHSVKRTVSATITRSPLNLFLRKARLARVNSRESSMHIMSMNYPESISGWDLFLLSVRMFHNCKQRISSRMI